MRQEMVETVTWAGKPQSIDNEPGSVASLTPRSSFHKWTQQVIGCSAPWRDLDIEAAEKLHEELLDYLERSNIEYLALRDSLTGLANRLSFERKMENSIRQSIEQDSMFAVFMIDLDNFKPVNDTMGHAAGDDLLIQVGTRLQTLVRDNDMVARLGGDEFALILNNIQANDQVDIVASRVLSEMKRTFIINESSVQIGASIGVSICPLDAASHEELLHDADLALYDVKNSGRDGFKRFDAAMLEGQEGSLRAKQRIDDAFAQNQLAFEYQPIVDSKTGRLDSFEAFCVWNHPEHGKIPAREFKDLIEAHQLATKWAEWGLEELFQQYQLWQQRGYRVVPIGLNLSAKQFLNTDIGAICKQLSKEYDVNTSWLRIDLDEQTLAMNSRRSEEKINELREVGILVNIDHFGQGAVSLGLLTRLKVNHLKINYERFHFEDSSYEVNAQLEIFKSISNVLKLPIVATRISDEHAHSIATSKGINFLQGNALSSPLHPSVATDYLANTND
jgi:diguanylate cyclase (GGDEF)-like protein